MTMDLDGTIVLTEGQTIAESAQGYKKLQAGIWRQESHTDIRVRLESVDVEHAGRDRRVAVASTLEFMREGEDKVRGLVEVNRPFEYGGLTFTQDDTGFSPRLRITHTLRKLPLGHVFVALATFRTGGRREYRDIVQLPLAKKPMKVTLYPTYVEQGRGKFAKAGDVPSDPMLELAVQDKFGNFAQRRYVRLGESTTIGQFTVEFTELREWSSFRVGDDPGYALVCVAFWVGLIAILLRYFDDLRAWTHELFLPGSSASQRQGRAKVVPPTVPREVSSR